MNIIKKIYQYSFMGVTVASMLAWNACTGDFVDTNTDPNAATEEELGYDNLGLGSLITQMENALFPCITKEQNIDVNSYQKMFCLAGDIYSGHQGASNMFDTNGNNNITYNMFPDWYSEAYLIAYQNYMTPWYNLLKKKDISPSTFAVGQVLKVYGMHRITDMYGPIPYENFIPASDVPFTPQETVYKLFFQELDEALGILNDFVQNNPGAKPLGNYDKIYGGDLTKWVKFANSLKLRLAMRTRYATDFSADGKTSQELAEEAIAAGVFADNEDNAMIKVDGSSTVNPLYMICYSYNDTRLGATMESYLKGYNDPRLRLWFIESEVSDGREFNGIRGGSVFNANDYKVFSNLNVAANTPIQVMTAAEVYFLRAEAALLGWNAGGDARNLYETGVTTAFAQPLGATQAKAGDASEYLQGTDLPAPYSDPENSSNNYRETGRTCVRWDVSEGNDRLLEKIITQKWIALFPDGQEAWSEFRRTGFPRVIPVANNRSNGNVDTDKQIARLPYPINIQTDYPESYQNAMGLLKGDDTAGTRLWWDQRTDKIYQN